MNKTSQKVIVLSIIVLLAIGGYYFYKSYFNKPVYQINFHGLVLHFRSDLREASKVETYPDDKAIADLLLDEGVRNITFLIPNTTDAGIYGVVSYGLAFKMTVIYNSIYSPFSQPVLEEEKNMSCIYYKDYDKRICFKKRIYENYENEIKKKEGEVKIILYGENYSGKPEIRVFPDESVVLVKGSKNYVDEKPYTGLDMAADHLILVLMYYVR